MKTIPEFDDFNERQKYIKDHLGELLDDAVEALALARDHARRLGRRRGEQVAELRAAALEAGRAGVGDVVRDDRHVGLGALEARKRRIE